MNNNLSNEKLNTDLQISFKNKTQFNEKEITLDSYPFQTCQILNFLTDENEIKYLINEVSNLKFYEKNNDLYTFKQTDDLNNLNNEYISKFKDLVKHEFKDWLEYITGIQLKAEINLTASKYQEYDVLLCHDDELDTRRIAFTYYLTSENWSKEFGGLLRLFDLNDIGEPNKIVKEISPVRNQMVWFEVSEDSYHEVSEVLSKTETRLSLHGWFHSELVPRRVRPKDPICLYISPTHVELQMVYNWINSHYLDPASQDKIKEKFENQSEIQLPNFLKKEKYNNLIDILSDSNLTWDDVGPNNKRCYNRLNKIENLELLSFLDLFKSEAMLLILSNITGLNFHPLYEEKNPNNEGDDDKIPNKRSKTEPEMDSSKITSRLNYELRRWSHGNYQLMYDVDEAMQNEFSLDVFMYFTNSSIDFDVGGYTSYINSEDGEHLLNVEPNKNCLNIVYKEKDTRKFVKYINHKINEYNIDNFYDLHFSYIE